MTAHKGAREFLRTLVDPDTFTSWDQPVDLTRLGADYRSELEHAAEVSGVDEAVVTGRASICGHDVAVIVGEFRFLAGSIGTATADRVRAAFERATRERLPVLAAPSSGGTRMQEGTPAFVRMVDVTRAVVQHKAAGLPYIVYLRHPTTGGVFASWGSLGHLTFAEPGALVGFLGPRVFEALKGRPFPAGVQTAENLADHGIVDAVVSTPDLRDLLERLLSLVVPLPIQPWPTIDSAGQIFEPAQPVWEAIQASRSPDRPGFRELLHHATDRVVLLDGTGAGEREPGIIVAMASLRGIPCVILGQDRTDQADHPLGPGQLRQARRGMQLAQELSLPLVTIIDTPGSDLSPAAEEGALAGEIARCLATMVSLTVPRVSVLLGQGCGGAALALLPADRVVAAENAWLSPLPPEGASAIVHRDAGRAAEMAQRQRIGVADLLRDGIVNVVVSETPTLDAKPEDFVERVADACAQQLAALLTCRGAA